MKKLIYVVDGGFAMDAGHWMGRDRTNNMEEASLVVFTGGADIHPALYNEDRHPYTHPHPRRDDYEVKEFEKARALNKPLLGVCRGAQLLCAMAGGKLVQHMENKGSHKVLRGDIDFGPTEYHVTSCHHQAQWPWMLPKADWTLLGYSLGTSEYHEDGHEQEIVNGMAALSEWGGGRHGDNLVEVEDVYYRKLNALACQSHPEWLGYSHPTLDHYVKLIELMYHGNLL